jgi:hypothetical protein
MENSAKTIDSIITFTDLDDKRRKKFNTINNYRNTKNFKSLIKKTTGL